MMAQTPSRRGFRKRLAHNVSILNDCLYSLANHWKNARHLIGDDERVAHIEKALRACRPQDMFDGRELKLLRYAEKLALSPESMVEADIDILRESGLDDGQILEANQIICYFNHANRTLNGLGLTTQGDTVGYYKSG